MFRTFCLLFSTCIAGCATHAARLHEAREAYFSGDLDRATSLLDEHAHGDERDRDCLLLDEAVVAFAKGDPRRSEQLLRGVRDRFDYLQQKSLAESTVSLLTDDTHAAYAGEDYERVLLRVLLAFSSLMQDGTDAVAYCLQVDQEQREIIQRGIAGAAENPQPAYQHVAVGAYLRGIMQEATHRNYDDAERAFATVAAWEPGFAPARFDLARAQTGAHSTAGNGVVYVFAFVGRGPYKEERVAEATSGALLIADNLLSAAGDHTLPPTIAPVKIPEVVLPLNNVDAVAVDIDGQPAGLTQTITDVGCLAVSQFEAKRDHVLARAVARRAIKKAAIYSSKDALDVQRGAANLALDAVGILWEATEAADTRCWGLLPEKIQVLRIELPAGEHTLALRAANASRPLGPAYAAAIEVADGRNAYVLASFPGQRLVGNVLVSRWR